MTPKQVVSGRLEVLSSADRRSCLHFAGEPVPEDADGEVESAASASKVLSVAAISRATCWPACAVIDTALGMGTCVCITHGLLSDGRYYGYTNAAWHHRVDRHAAAIASHEHRRRCGEQNKHGFPSRKSVRPTNASVLTHW